MFNSSNNTNNFLKIRLKYLAFLAVNRHSYVNSLVYHGKRIVHKPMTRCYEGVETDILVSLMINLSLFITEIKYQV